MREPCLFDDESLARAIRVAKEATRRAGAPAGDAVVLYRSRRVVLHFPTIATVARIGPANATSLAADARELSVTRYLARKGAPVVAPSDLMGPSPFLAEDLAVTLWPKIDHETRDYDDEGAGAVAAVALRRVHEHLADYPGALPPYSERIAQCAALLRGADTPPALAADDRTFLLQTYERLSEALSQFDIRSSPLHGDAHMGNVFFTPSGPLWMDFEAVCCGPYEWDVAATLCPAAFPALDPDLYDVLRKLRSFCVVVWCSAFAHHPEKRAAAADHLALLKAAAARRGARAQSR